MTLLLPMLYGLLLAFWLYRDKRFRLYALPCYTVAVLFLVKCGLGVAYMHFHQELYNGGDTMKFIRDGKIVYETLSSDTMAYLRLTFGPNGVDMPASFQPQLDAMGFWSDTSAYMMVRFNALANLFTFGNEYGNIVIMALLSTLGMVALIKVFSRQAVLPALLLVPFLIPSILFWTSGIHKESLLLFSLGISIWGMYKWGGVSKSIWAVIAMALGLTLTYFIRDFIFFLMVPAILGWILSKYINSNKLLVYAGVYALVLVVGYWIPVYEGENYLHLIVEKQQQFMALEAGNSQIAIKHFEPSITAVLLNLPKSLFNTLLGPFLLKADGLIHWAAIIENAGFLLLLVWGAWKTNWKQLWSDNISLLIMFLCATYLILIGYIVPNIGAISRYRSLALLFGLLGLYAHIKANKAVHN